MSPRTTGTPIPNFTWSDWGTMIETNITVSLTNGAIKSFTPKFTGYTQDPNDSSQFHITMTATDLDVSYAWTEQYTETAPHSWPTPYGPNRYSYDITFDSFAVTAIFKLGVANGGYQLTYVSSSVQSGTATSHVPSGSVLNHQPVGGCTYATHVSAATAQQLSSMDFGSKLGGALQPIFASISDSGNLGAVEFDFLAPGDSGLVFTSGGGVQIGATGMVSVNKVPYPGTAPADLPLPPVPTGNPPPHVAYYVQDYEVNALFWGFYAAGVLKTTLTAGLLKDPQALETNTYQGGSLNNLALKYPGLFMSADLALQAAPVIAFGAVYQLTAANLAQIQAALGSTVWSQIGASLSQLENMTFSSQAGFEQELALINQSLSTYAATIEQYSGMPGVVVTHTAQCILNVLQNETPIPVITFDVAQTFVMENLGLGVSSTGTTQSVIFDFVQPMDALPKASFVSSTIPGVDGGDFSDVWDALRSNWQDVFGQIGTAGLPLPRIPGFEFLFQQATVAVKPPVAGADGYLSIVANVSYSAEALAPAVREIVSQRPVRLAA